MTPLVSVNLGNLAANYAQLRQTIDPAHCAAVVKANGYGLGARQVASALWDGGCRTFFVATLGEGLTLRQQLPEATVYVLNGLETGLEHAYANAGLRPVLNDLTQVRAWLGNPALRDREAALQVDTGMARLGLTMEEAKQAALLIERGEFTHPVLVMSHLACADEPDHPLNNRQKEALTELASLFPGVPLSLANSSGIFLGPDFHFDLARPGAALYGIDPRPHSGQGNPMRPVVTLDAPIIALRQVTEPTTVGYGATATLLPPGRVATVAMGYADGLPRTLGNRGQVLLGGKRLAIIGRVSMDLTTIDVSNLPVGAVALGERVEFIAPRLPVDEVAALAGTIGYEILTGLGGRCRFRYLA